MPHSSDDAARIEQLIRDAFACVTLEDGIGLFEGQAIDSYAGPKAQAAARLNDETRNWGRIPVDALNAAHSSLSFFDAKGMRFHLPAFLIADLRDELQQGIVFHLMYAGDDAESRFSLLNAKQRAAVQQFLLYHLRTTPEPERTFAGPMIDKAIADFWR
ncbi:MAG: hypothetical protein KDA96_07650 [Planctomycetaceae bacterium]|nr:hypothetical protein [Planctomycetaceae bacterium]